MTWRTNPGYIPNGLEAKDRLEVRFVLPDGRLSERTVTVKGLYWGSDRPVRFDEWRRAV